LEEISISGYHKNFSLLLQWLHNYTKNFFVTDIIGGYITFQYEETGWAFKMPPEGCYNWSVVKLMGKRLEILQEVYNADTNSADKG